MMIIKLIHPVHGIVAQQVLTYNQTKHKSIKEWKYKYGKKFKECVVEIEGKLPETIRKRYAPSKSIENTRTGEIYSSVAEAAKENSLTPQSVYMQCKKKHTRGYDYWLKYA